MRRDHAPWTQEQEQHAQDIVQRHLDYLHSSTNKLSISPQEHENNLAEDWDVFYRKNQDRFFKDRKWLSIEFPELFLPTTQAHVVLFCIGFMCLYDLGKQDCVGSGLWCREYPISPFRISIYRSTHVHLCNRFL